MFKKILSKIEGYTGSSVLGIAEEVAKGALRQLPVVGGIAHHMMDRAKDLRLDLKLQSLKEAKENIQFGLTQSKQAIFSLSQAKDELEKKLLNSTTKQKEQFLLQKQSIIELEELITINHEELLNKQRDIKLSTEILEDKTSSQEIKIAKIKEIAENEKIRIDNFESKMLNFQTSLDNLSARYENLEKQQVEISQNVNKLNSNYSSLQSQSSSNLELIQSLTNRIKELENEQDKKNQLSLISEIQELQKIENSLLAKLQLLEKNRLLFEEEKEQKESSTKLFNLSISDDHWITKELLSSITEKYPLENTVYDYYLAKYDKFTMRNWIRSETGNIHGENNNSEEYLEWKTNHSLITNELLAIQSKISAKLDLLNNSSLILENTPLDYSQLLEKVEKDLSAIAQEKEIISQNESSIAQEIFQEKENLKNNTFNWKLFFFLLIPFSSAIYFYRKKKKTLKKKFSWLFHFSLISSLLLFGYFFYSFYRYKSISSNLDSLNSSLTKNLENKKEISQRSDDLLIKKRKEILSLTKAESPSSSKVNPSEINFSLIEQYLLKTDYQFTNFLSEVNERREFSSFSQYKDYIFSFRKKSETEIIPLIEESFFSLEEIIIIEDEYRSLNYFLTKVNYPLLKSFIIAYRQEKVAFLALKDQYPELTPSYSDKLLIKLNSLTLPMEVKKFLADNNFIPQKEEFFYWKKKGEKKS